MHHAVQCLAHRLQSVLRNEHMNDIVENSDQWHFTLPTHRQYRKLVGHQGYSNWGGTQTSMGTVQRMGLIPSWIYLSLSPLSLYTIFSACSFYCLWNFLLIQPKLALRKEWDWKYIHVNVKMVKRDLPSKDICISTRPQASRESAVAQVRETFSREGISHHPWCHPM